MANRQYVERIRGMLGLALAQATDMNVRDGFDGELAAAVESMREASARLDSWLVKDMVRSALISPRYSWRRVSRDCVVRRKTA